jgi:hypothetical protein
MANPLARVIMNNIAQNSGRIDLKTNPVNSAYRVSSLDNKEEQLLLGVINKKSERNIGTSKTLESLSGISMAKASSQPSTKPKKYDNQRGNCFEKVKLEDLIKGCTKLENKATQALKKSNTMMTLDELAGKAKKVTEGETSNALYPAQEKVSNNNSVYVKTGIINNLEAYIPKVSLESIGKKGSLLK